MLLAASLALAGTSLVSATSISGCSYLSAPETLYYDCANSAVYAECDGREGWTSGDCKLAAVNEAAEVMVECDALGTTCAGAMVKIVQGSLTVKTDLIEWLPGTTDSTVTWTAGAAAIAGLVYALPHAEMAGAAELAGVAESIRTQECSATLKAFGCASAAEAAVDGTPCWSGRAHMFSTQGVIASVGSWEVVGTGTVLSAAATAEDSSGSCSASPPPGGSVVGAEFDEPTREQLRKAILDAARAEAHQVRAQFVVLPDTDAQRLHVMDMLLASWLASIAEVDLSESVFVIQETS